MNFQTPTPRPAGPGERAARTPAGSDQTSYFYSGDGSGAGLHRDLPDPSARRPPRAPAPPPVKIGRLGIPILDDLTTDFLERERWKREKEKRERERKRSSGTAGKPPPLPQLLDTILNDQINNGFLHFAVRNQRLYRKFNEMMGTDYRGRIEACGKQLGTLYVRADSPHLMERCVYRKKEWIELLNREMGEEVVTDIRIRVLQAGEPFPELASAAPPPASADEEEY
ncbi:MAG: DUF721 domain-containing protein [Deltaproteobacteria bacterium]|jgi:hypothetical protein|nr:DUF721 domain-containing protein [Deltaproteobacteria bacterium]